MACLEYSFHIEGNGILANEVRSQVSQKGQKRTFKQAANHIHHGLKRDHENVQQEVELTQEKAGPAKNVL